MFELRIHGKELYDENTNEFIYTDDSVLILEHSLLSISKWESKWHKPFLGYATKTEEEILDYFRCMTITKNVDANIYRLLTKEQAESIKEYIDDPMTATWFNEKNNPRSRSKIVTSELIYYWMVSLQIPFECEKWHLNRLLTLIRVCNVENQPKKKMKRSDIYKQNAALNAARKASNGV